MSASTVSGIITTSNNERIIPASRRPDGTLRKERRVREGYTPPEDIARYKNSKVAAAEQQKNPVIPVEKPKTKTQKKNDKRKAKRLAERQNVSDVSGEPGDASSGDGQSQSFDKSLSAQFERMSTDAKQELEGKIRHETDKTIKNSEETSNKTQAAESLQDSVKRIKALEKKIRQVERLIERREAGEKLSPEEQEKAGKLPAFLNELEMLKKL